MTTVGYGGNKKVFLKNLYYQLILKNYYIKDMRPISLWGKLVGSLVNYLKK